MSDKSKDFESLVGELETVVKTLEEGDPKIEKDLKRYERGKQLIRLCRQRLEESERRIEILTERGEVRAAPGSLDAAGVDAPSQ